MNKDTVPSGYSGRSLKNLMKNANNGDIRSIYQLYLNYFHGEHTEIDKDMSDEYLSMLAARISSSKIKLDEVSFNDFRGLSNLSIKLDSNLTVIVGSNGSGKTTVLDGVAIVLSWLKANILKEDRPGNSIKESDINNDESVKYSSITARLSLANAYFDVMISRAKEGSKEKRNSELLGVKAIAGIYRNLNEYNKNWNIPLVAYYSVARSNEGSGIDLKRVSTLNNKEWTKFDAYEDVLSDRHDFGDFLSWLIRVDNISKQSNTNDLLITYKELLGQLKGSIETLNVIKKMGDFDKQHLLPLEMDINQKEKRLKELQNTIDSAEMDISSRLMAHIKRAFAIFLPDLKDIKIHYSTKNIKLLLIKNKVELDAQQLSQGEKSVLTLIGDLTRRLVMLNPGLDNPLHGDGVVLIDEIDLHLHPSWQQKIIANLRDVFPNIQFIITTHSPQVLSTVDSNSIRIIREELNSDGSVIITLKKPLYQTKGVISADILAQIMNTDPKPNVIEATWLDDYKGIIEVGDLESYEAKELEQKLVKHFGAEHPLMIECLALKAVRELKNKLAQRKNK